MDTKFRGNNREDQWREQQRRKQRERQEAEEIKEKARKEARTAQQEEPGKQTEASGEGTPTESDNTTESPADTGPITITP